jgi:L-iditol 2-dehydrogenase
LEAVGKLVYKDVPTPEPKENEVLLKIKACGVCSSDIDRVFKTGTYNFPTIPGHEFCGEIVKAGSNVDSSMIGKKAVVFPLLPCNKCPSCEKENYAQCSNYNYFGSRCDGAFAEYLAAPVWNVLTFSDKVPFDHAAMCEPAAVAMHAVKLSELNKGDTICIVGTGTIGILCGLWAQKQGAKNIIFIGRNARKKQFIESLGFSNVLLDVDGLDAAIANITEGKGVDIAFECVGSNQAISTAIKSLKQKGRMILVGNPEGDISLARNIYWKILRSELDVKGAWNSKYSSKDNDWKDVLKAMEDNDLPFDKLITGRHNLSEADKAFDRLREKTIFTVKELFVNE